MAVTLDVTGRVVFLREPGKVRSAHTKSCERSQVLRRLARDGRQDRTDLGGGHKGIRSRLPPFLVPPTDSLSRNTFLPSVVHNKHLHPPLLIRSLGISKDRNTQVTTAESRVRRCGGFLQPQHDWE